MPSLPNTIQKRWYKFRCSVSNNLNAVAIAFTVDFLFSLQKLTKYSLLFLCKIYANFAKNLICVVASFRNIVDEKKETEKSYILFYN